MGNVEHLTVPEQNQFGAPNLFAEVQNFAQIPVKSQKKVITSEEVLNSAQISPNVLPSAWPSALSDRLRPDIQINKILCHFIRTQIFE